MIADTKLHYRPKSKNCHKCNWNMSLIGTGVKRWCCLTSVAYVGPKSRTERPRKTKIGTEVAHVTRDSDTAFKVKGQGHQAALLTAALTRQALAEVTVGRYWPWEPTATLRSAGGVGSAARRASAHAEGGEGWGILWRPSAYSLLCPGR